MDLEPGSAGLIRGERSQKMEIKKVEPFCGREQARSSGHARFSCDGVGRRSPQAKSPAERGMS